MTRATIPLHEPAMTRHARKRWDERFGDLSLTAEWYSAKAVTPKQRRALMDRMPARARELGRWFTGKFFLCSKNGVVFVVAKRNLVITVLPLPHLTREAVTA